METRGEGKCEEGKRYRERGKGEGEGKGDTDIVMGA